MVTDTSLLAYSKVLETLSKRHVQVYEVIQRLQPCTNEMIAQDLNIPINRVTGRTNELRFRKKVIMLAKKDICPVMKGMAQFYRVRRKI